MLFIFESPPLAMKYRPLRNVMYMIQTQIILWPYVWLLTVGKVGAQLTDSSTNFSAIGTRAVVPQRPLYVRIFSCRY